MDKKLWLLILLGAIVLLEGYRHRDSLFPKPEKAWTPQTSNETDFSPTRPETFLLLEGRKFDQLEALIQKHRGLPIKLGNCDETTPEIFYGYFDFSSSVPDSRWESIASLLQEWAKAYPKSPTPLAALGELYINYGWKARGSGYADTVSPQGWELLKERLTKAKGYLERAAALQMQDPCLYSALITVAMGLSDLPRDYMESAYERGVAVAPYYMPTYYAKANYLLPRWYGARGEWEAWLKKAADDRGGKEGDIIYAWVASYVSGLEYQDFFHLTAADYPRMKRGFEAALELTGPKEASINLNYLCFFACLAGDRSTAKKCFQRMDGHWLQSIWGSKTYFDRWRAWVANPILNASPGPNRYDVQ